MDLTVELFVELTLKMLPKVIEKLDDALAEHREEIENAADPDEEMGIIMGIVMELRAAVAQELLPEGITSEDMETFHQEHEGEIQEYIGSNPEILEQWRKYQEEIQNKFPPP